MGSNAVTVLLAVVVTLLGPTVEAGQCSKKQFHYAFPHPFTVIENGVETGYIEDCFIWITKCSGSCEATFNYDIHKKIDPAPDPKTFCSYSVNCCTAVHALSIDNIQINPATDCIGRNGGPRSSAVFTHPNQIMATDDTCECKECMQSNGPHSDYCNTAHS